MSFELSQKVLFRHCDPAGIVFYPRYFEMLNDTVESFFGAIGHPFESMHRGGHSVPTAQIETTFTLPSEHGDQLLIALDVTRIGRSSLGLSFKVTCGEETRLIAASTLVYINPSKRSESWPDNLRSALTPYLRSDT